MIPEKKDYQCTVAVTLEVVGGKWKAVILWHLSHKTLRFSQLQRRLPGVTQKMLTQQLRELERDGMIHREVYPEVPPRVEYSLTDEGSSLVPLLTLMCTWGRQRLKKMSGEAGKTESYSLVKSLKNS
jgi:DNA-binding HxlR family transcriptional regulator